MQIPFVEGFGHSLKTRKASNSVIVRLETDEGAVGYGEGAPRPYVTGETVESMTRSVSETFWPALKGVDLPPGDADDLLAQLNTLLPEAAPSPDETEAGVLSHQCARAAVELALLDAILKHAERSLGTVIPPSARPLVYSGVITSGSAERVMANARRMKSIGLSQYKVKLGFEDDAAIVAALREALGPEASIRVDANGAWTLEQALDTLQRLEPYNIASCEEPLGRSRMAELPTLAAQSPIPIMVDESLCTLEDARWLGEHGGCHFFNVRVSKCGGIGRSLEFVSVARQYGLRLQVGSHVGETSILAAAGRHLAASLEDLEFLEGSYGTILLSVDVTRQSVRFGHRGIAPALKGSGLGIRVLDERLAQHAASTHTLND